MNNVLYGIDINELVLIKMTAAYNLWATLISSNQPNSGLWWIHTAGSPIIKHSILLKIDTHTFPDSKVHGANMGPIWGRQDPDGPHVGSMNFAIWVVLPSQPYSILVFFLENWLFYGGT